MNASEYAEHAIAALPITIKKKEHLWLVQHVRRGHVAATLMVRPEHVIAVDGDKGLLRIRVESEGPVLGLHGPHALTSYWSGSGRQKNAGWAALESLQPWPADLDEECAHTSFRNFRDVTCTRCGRQLRVHSAPALSA